MLINSVGLKLNDLSLNISVILTATLSASSVFSVSSVFCLSKTL